MILFCYYVPSEFPSFSNDLLVPDFLFRYIRISNKPNLPNRKKKKDPKTYMKLQNKINLSQCGRPNFLSHAMIPY